MKKTKNDSKHQFFCGVRKIAFIDHQHFGEFPFHRSGKKTLSGRSERTFFPKGKQFHRTPLIAYKGTEPEQECENARNALKELGGEVEKIEKYKLDGTYERSFIIVKKVKKTPLKYPRGQNKPRIMPL